MITLLLVGFAATLAAGAPRLLVAARWAYRSPRLAILAWHAIAYAALAALTTSAVVALMHWTRGHELACTVWQVCLDALRGAHGRIAQLLAAAGLVVLATLLARLVIAWQQVIAAGTRARRRHLDLLRLTATTHPDLDAIVLPGPDPAAYLVPGRDPHVVITSGALGRLSPAEVAAVLAHERAHATGRHDRLRAAVQLLHRAFPGIPVFAHATRQVDRLIELCADEVAVRQHGALSLARALVAMAVPAPAPGALHAAGGDAAERLRRLLDPPAPLARPITALAAAGWTLLPAAPLLIVAIMRLAPIPS
jgi:Zn-dependent protease with chaperone function